MVKTTMEAIMVVILEIQETTTLGPTIRELAIVEPATKEPTATEVA